MPPPAPRAMPRQRLGRLPPAGKALPDAPRWRRRRAFVLTGAAVLAAVPTLLLAAWLGSAGWAPPAVLLLGLFAVTAVWIALAFVNAAIGFFLLAFPGGHEPAVIVPQGPHGGSGRRPRSRTAVLVPVYHEDMASLSRHLRRLLGGLASLDAQRAFDVVVLSDSRDPEAAAAETAALADLRASHPSRPLYYRRRRRNVGRKAGNLVSWCRRYGGAYEYMVVLDADSELCADTLIRLTLAMEDHPDAALMQTVPVLLPGRTFFGRMQAFSAQLHAPVIGHGLAFWHGPSSNYWGHNAILRVSAFCAAARLPRLPGRAPLGGEILSHDFVEAALLRRAGWKLYLLPGLEGSREDAPQTLLDYALRDRRWCQGNVQHARVLAARGLVGMSRLHLLTGIMSYAAAPCWMLMLVLGAALLPAARADEAGGAPVAALLAALAVLLLGTRLCGLLSVWRRRALHRRWPRLTASAVLETLLVALLAPLHMVTHTLALCQVVLLRRDAGWQAQRRGDGLPPASLQAAAYVPHVLVAAGATLLFVWLGALTVWLVPVLGVLWLAPLVALAASSRRLGMMSARARLFALPDTAAARPHRVRHPAAAQPDVMPLAKPANPPGPPPPGQARLRGVG